MYVCMYMLSRRLRLALRELRGLREGCGPVHDQLASLSTVNSVVVLSLSVFLGI